MSSQAPSSSSTFRFRSNRGSARPTTSVADEQRQHVVAVLPLRLRHEHLQPVVEVPERLGAGAVGDEPVER